MKLYKSLLVVLLFLLTTLAFPWGSELCQGCRLDSSALAGPIYTWPNSAMLQQMISTNGTFLFQDDVNLYPQYSNGIKLEIRTQNKAPLRLAYDTNNYVDFSVGSSGSLTINAMGGVVISSNGNVVIRSGNVGIGTASPIAKLSVAGQISAQSAYSTYTADGLFGITALPSKFSTQGQYGILLGYSDNGQGGYFPRIGFQQDYNVSGSPLTTSSKSSIGMTQDGTFTINTGPSNSFAMAISPSGNVGIGTTVPAGKLVLLTNVDNGIILRLGDTNTVSTNFDFTRNITTGALQIQGNQVGYTNIVLAPINGNIGIGTTSPPYNLTVAPGGIGSGLGVGWNVITNRGETDFYNYGRGGVGGFSFWNYSAPGQTYPTSGSKHLMSITSEGNVGVGTTVPLFNLQVGGYGLATSQLWGASSWSQSGLMAFTPGYVNDGAINTYGFHTDSSGIGTYLRLDAGSAIVFTGVAINSGLGSANQSQWNVQYSDNASTWYTAYVGVDLTRNLGGWTQVTWRLDNVTPAHRYWQLYKTNTAAGGGYVQEVQFFSAVPEPNLVRADAGGNVGIGTTGPNYKLEVNGTAANSTGVWTNLSDVRLKTDIRSIKDALETVNKLRGVMFQWKDPVKGIGVQRGFIAQEVEPIIPEWVKTQPDGYKALEKNGVEALLVEAIKELEFKNESDIKTLKAEKDAELASKNAEIKELKTAYDTKIKILEQEIAEIKRLLTK